MTKAVYLDSNVFFYLADPTCPYHAACRKLFTFCRDKGIHLATSTETIQELVHFSVYSKQAAKGLKLAEQTIGAIQLLLPVDASVIRRYLGLIPKYQTVASRDVLHLAAALQHGIDYIVSYDRQMRTFQEVSVVTAEEFTDSR